MRLRKIREAIRRHKTFLVTTHEHPDLDALGSELSLAMYLRALGKKVYIVNDESLPSRYGFLPGADRIGHYGANKGTSCEVVIVLDCGELRRIGRVRKLILQDSLVINIDHHITNDFFGACNLVDARASSTAEILYAFLRQVGHTLTRDLAFNLYVGIMTDTGSFRFENTSVYTHRAVSELMKFGFPVTDVYHTVYESIPPHDFRGFAGLVSQFSVLFGGRVVYLDLSQKTVSRFSENFDLREAIFRFLRSMKGVEVFMIFTEISPRETRVNFRAGPSVDVACLAQSFNGGGHPRASGCTIAGDIPYARGKVVHQLRRIFNARRLRQDARDD